MTAAVRPEDIRLTDEPAGPNVVRGVVRLVEYQGREYDVAVELAGGATLRVRLPRAVAVGSPVGLLDADRVVMLPAEADS